MNPNITWDIVLANNDKPWDWYGLTRNHIITWDIISTNPNKPWDWGALSSTTSSLIIPTNIGNGGP
jgi:hypothetical protein